MSKFRLLVTTLLVALCTGFSACGGDDDITTTSNEDGNGSITGTTAKVDLKKAGSLSTILSDDAKFKITDLTITGNINGDDIILIREMAGADMNGDETKGQLSILNLKDANIVAGGNPYYITSGEHPLFAKKDIIGSNIFSHCNKLTSIILPNSATEIERDIFNEHSYGAPPKSTSLTTITIGDKVQTIDYRAFWGCDGLKEFIVAEGNSNYSSLNGVLFNKNKSILIECPQAKSSCTIPNSVITIESSAFSGCSSLTSVTIGDKVTIIGGSAFDGCSGLTSVTIPNSVTTIGYWAFNECSSLTEMHCQGTTPASANHGNIGNDDLYNICKLYVPKGSLQQYKTAINWSRFQTIIEE